MRIDKESLLTRARELSAKAVEAAGVPNLGETVSRRAARLPSEDLVSWAETTVTAVGRSFGDWQREGKQEGLDEARLSVAALAVVLDELNRRRTGRRL
jgi:hypothetical protein